MLKKWNQKIYDVNAYVEDGEKPIEEVVSELFASFDENDEVLVFADMMGGVFIKNSIHI